MVIKEGCRRWVVFEEHNEICEVELTSDGEKDSHGFVYFDAVGVDDNTPVQGPWEEKEFHIDRTTAIREMIEYQKNMIISAVIREETSRKGRCQALAFRGLWLDELAKEEQND